MTFPSHLHALNDVSRAYPTGGQELIYDDATKLWTPGNNNAHPMQAPAGVTGFGLPGVVCTAASTLGPLTASTAYYMPFVVLKRITITLAGIYVSTQSTTVGAKVRLAIYRMLTTGQPGALVADLGQFDVKTALGKVVSGALSVALAPGNYLLRVHSDASASQCTLAGLRGSPITGTWISDNALNNFVTQIQKALAYAAPEDPGTAWDTYVNATTPLLYLGSFQWSPT